MIDWEEDSGGIQVTDRRTSLLIDADGWSNGLEPKPLPRPVDEAIAGSVERVTVRATNGSLAHLTDDRSIDLPTDGPLRLGGGAYALQLDSAIPTTIRFSGPAVIRRESNGGRFDLHLDDRRPITLGFTTPSNTPDGPVTVTPDVAGIAAAVTACGRSLRNLGPGRSHPAARPHPPLVQVGDRIEVPDRPGGERSVAPQTTMVVPRERPMAAFVTAPLAYYLGAAVEPGTVEQPELVGDHAPDEPLPLGSGRRLEATVETALRRLVFVDSLLRRSDRPDGADRDLERLGLDGDLAGLSAPARLEAALGVDDGTFDPLLPDWHLSASLPVGTRSIEAVPYLLDRLSLIQPPRTTQLDTEELLARSLEDFYRSVGRRAARVDVVGADRAAGRSHAWFGPEAPIDVFNATTTAFENGHSESDATGRMSVHVVRNGPEMGEEHRIVADIYRRHARQLPIDVAVHDSLTREDLTDLLARHTSFLHYVGHCEVDGLRCADGTLSMGDIDECNAETFFLNACGSYFEGRELIERGSIAGGVTYAKVLNEQAATVGTTFARLLSLGFNIDRAMDLARRRIIMGKNYAVVGDGTYVLVEGTTPGGTTTRIERGGDEDGFAVAVEAEAIHRTGGCYRAPIGDGRRQLEGRPVTASMSRSELCEWLSAATVPILYEGDLTWPERLLDRLSPDR